MLTPEQLKAREGKLFSTDAPVALGISPYKTPVELWREKRGEPLPPKEQTQPMYFGLALQSFIAKEYERRTGIQVREADYTKFHPDIPWMGSHFDYVVNETRGLEIKNFHDRRRKDFGDPGTDEVPTDVIVQCLHQAIVHNWQYVDVAVLFGGQEFGIWTVYRDEEVTSRLIEKEAEFMALVASGTPPEPRTPEESRALWPTSRPETIEASPQIAALCARLRAAKDDLKAREAEMETTQTLIQSAMRDADTLVYGSSVLATWKQAKDSAYFDRTMFEKEQPDMCRRYTSTRPGGRRFLIK